MLFLVAILRVILWQMFMLMIQFVPHILVSLIVPIDSIQGLYQQGQSHLFFKNYNLSAERIPWSSHWITTEYRWFWYWKSVQGNTVLKGHQMWGWWYYGNGTERQYKMYVPSDYDHQLLLLVFPLILYDNFPCCQHRRRFCTFRGIVTAGNSGSINGGSHIVAAYWGLPYLGHIKVSVNNCNLFIYGFK